MKLQAAGPTGGYWELSLLVMAAAEIGGARCCLRCRPAPLRFAIPATGVRLALLAIGQAVEQTRDRWSRQTPVAHARQVVRAENRVIYCDRLLDLRLAGTEPRSMTTGFGRRRAEPPYCAPITAVAPVGIAVVVQLAADGLKRHADLLF